MRHFTCAHCNALVFTENPEGTRCANCLLREATEIPHERQEHHKETKMVPFPKYPHIERDEDFAY